MPEVLVVDDDHRSCKMLTRAISRSSFNVTSTSNSTQACDIITENDYDVIISDIIMPGLNGIQLLKHVNSNSPDSKVILVTGQPTLGTATEAIRLGAFDYLQKPIKLDLLSRRVNAAIYQRQLEQENIKIKKQLEMMVQKRTSELNTTKSRYASMISTIPDMVLETDVDGRIIYSNEYVTQNLGYSADYLKKRSISDFLEQDDSARVNEIRDFLLNHGSVVRHQILAFKKDNGEFAPSEVHISKLQVGNSPPSILYLARDILERIESDEEKQKMEIQLRQKQQIEAITQLTAGLSHEINTPTQYVQNNILFIQKSVKDILEFLEFISNTCNPKAFSVKNTSKVIDSVHHKIEELDIKFISEEIPEAIDQSLEGINRVSNIVRSIKDFSHPGAKGKIPVNINKALRNVVNLCVNEWKYYSNIIFDLTEELPLVNCYALDLNQALLYLIINASQANRRKTNDDVQTKGNITIRTQKTNESIEIQIKDTGDGIEKSIQDKLFNPSLETSLTSEKGYKGLAIAHEVIVERHNGTIEFKTREGIGTTFCIRLPIV